MKIFDGVTVNPNNLNPTLQGLLGVAMLFAGTLVEADKERQRRAAKAKEQATTLEEVMEQSGLDIPRLEDALAKFMGGSPEAKEAASFIARAPDPVKLLRQFAQEYTTAAPAPGPIVTPPPAADATSAAPPQPAAAASSATPPRATRTSFRPEFTREGMEAAANAAPRPRPKPAQFRPEFTREGMDAARVAAAAAHAPAAAPPSVTTAPTATAAPQPTGTVSPSSPDASPAPAGSPTRVPSLADALGRRLAARDRRIEVHQAELETRVRCIEAELALLREEVQQLHRTRDCSLLFLVPSADPPTSPTSMDAEPPPVASSSTNTTPESEVGVDAIDAEVSIPAAPVEVARTTPEVPVQAHSEPATDEETTTAGPVPDRPAQATPAPAVSTPDPGELRSSETDDIVASPPTAGEESLPPPASEDDLVRAVEMLDEFSERTEAGYMQQIEQVKGMEGEVKLLRALVARELVARPAVSHG